MQTGVVLLLFGTAIIGVLVLFVMLNNERRAIKMNEILSQKERDLIDLYSMLEQMMQEIDAFTGQAKIDIQKDKEQVKKLYDQICESKPAGGSSQPDEQPVPQVQEALIQEPDNERFKTQAARCADLKEIKVQTLYNKGVSVAEIAKQMNMGQGEVELILYRKNKMIQKILK